MCYYVRSFFCKIFVIALIVCVCGALCSLSNPNVFPIIGGSRASQIEDSMKGADIVLSNDELAEIFCDYKTN